MQASTVQHGTWHTCAPRPFSIFFHSIQVPAALHAQPHMVRQLLSMSEDLGAQQTSTEIKSPHIGSLASKNAAHVLLLALLIGHKTHVRKPLWEDCSSYNTENAGCFGEQSAHTPTSGIAGRPSSLWGSRLPAPATTQDLCCSKPLWRGPCAR